MTAAEQARDGIARVLNPSAFDRPAIRGSTRHADQAKYLGAAERLLTCRDPAILVALSTHLWAVAPETQLEAGLKAGTLHREAEPSCSEGTDTTRLATPLDDDD